MIKNKYIVNYYADPGTLWKKKAPLLRSIDFELTERCNNNCIHCCINLPENDDSARKKELSTKDWFSLIDQAAELGVLTVRFTGGEPLLRGDFIELYLYARRTGMKVLIFTNACLITPELADLFFKIPPLEEIEISAYGMKRDSYESVTRKRGSFDEYRKGLHLLLERNIPFIVKGTLFPETRDEKEEFITWASTIPWMDSFPSFAMFLELRHRRDSKIKNKRIKDLRISPKEGLKILTLKPSLYKKESARFCNTFLEEPNNNIINCNFHNSLCIDAYGKIQFCLALRHPETVFDFREHSLNDVLTQFIPEFRKQKSRNPDFLNRCGKCFLRSLCEQCPAKSWSEHGSIDQPVDYVCEIAHEQARYLGLLKKNERSWQVRNWRDRLVAMNEIINND
jgi:radical SAM protein with 4Fe4S-binding SPASM domain